MSGAAFVPMAASRIVWSDLLYESEDYIVECLQTLHGIPHYAYSVLASELHKGHELSFCLLNDLEIESRFWYQFDDEDDEFEMNGTFDSEELDDVIQNLSNDLRDNPFKFSDVMNDDETYQCDDSNAEHDLSDQRNDPFDDRNVRNDSICDLKTPAGSRFIIQPKLFYASEEVILESLRTLEGIPPYAYSVLTSRLQAGYEITWNLLNDLEIEPRFWSQFDEMDGEYDLTFWNRLKVTLDMVGNKGYNIMDRSDVGNIILMSQMKLTISLISVMWGRINVMTQVQESIPLMI